jgi:hypothetical protein
MTRGPVAIPAGGTVRIRIGTPAARFIGNVKLELFEPPPGITVARCDRGADHVEVVLACDATKARPGMQGNLLFQAIGERNGAKQGKGTAKTQRSPLGLVPAIPFDVVAAEPST